MKKTNWFTLTALGTALGLLLCAAVIEQAHGGAIKEGYVARSAPALSMTNEIVFPSSSTATIRLKYLRLSQDGTNLVTFASGTNAFTVLGTNTTSGTNVAIISTFTNANGSTNLTVGQEVVIQHSDDSTSTAFVLNLMNSTNVFLGIITGNNVSTNDILYPMGYAVLGRLDNSLATSPYGTVVQSSGELFSAYRRYPLLIRVVTTNASMQIGVANVLYDPSP